MKLYYTPGSCSLAPHIVARELSLNIELVRVDLATKETEAGQDYLEINAKGTVPALVLDSGEVLTETSPILLYLEDRNPGVPASEVGELGRYRTLEALNFVSTELHKTLGAMFNPEMPEVGKAVLLATVQKRFEYLNMKLATRDYFFGPFSIADAYAFTILNWTRFLKIDLGAWPHLTPYLNRIAKRPAVQAALAAEGLIPSPAQAIPA